MSQDVGIADQQKAGKQGRNDSIKQFSIQPHPTYHSFEIAGYTNFQRKGALMHPFHFGANRCIYAPYLLGAVECFFNTMLTFVNVLWCGI